MAEIFCHDLLRAVLHLYRLFEHTALSLQRDESCVPSLRRILSRRAKIPPKLSSILRQYRIPPAKYHTNLSQTTPMSFPSRTRISPSKRSLLSINTTQSSSRRPSSNKNSISPS